MVVKKRTTRRTKETDKYDKEYERDKKKKGFVQPKRVWPTSKHPAKW